MDVFLDGASHYNTAYLLSGGKYSAIDQTGVTWTQAAEGPQDGCIVRQCTGQETNQGFLTIAPQVVQGSVWSPQLGGVFGESIKVADLSKVLGGAPSAGYKGSYLTIYEGSFPCIIIMLNPDGTFSYYRPSAVGGGGTLVATSIAGVISDQWADIRVKWFSDASNGYVQIMSGPLLILDYQGDTMANGFPIWTPTGLWTSINNAGMNSTSASPFLLSRHANRFVFDLQGSYNNDFPTQNAQIIYTIPNGVGNYSQWTPLSGDNYANVNEVPPDGDTSYIAATTAGTQDCYPHEDIPPGDILAVQHVACIRRTDAGPATFKTLSRLGGSDFEGVEQAIPSEDFTFIRQPYDTNPNTGVPYTPTDFNAGEYGPIKAS